MKDDLEFRELRRVLEDNDGWAVVVYALTYQGENFGYLYVNRAQYSLAWTAPTSFEFDGKQPFTFIEEQLCITTPTYVKFMDLTLPNRAKHRDVALMTKGFYYDKSVCTLIFGSERRIREYDLLADQDRDNYITVLQNSNRSSIVFARYDSVVQTKTSTWDFCFTVESPVSAASESWEFAVNLPRKLPLSERAFRWIARNHRVKRLDKQVFDASLLALIRATDPAKNVFVP